MGTFPGTLTIISYEQPKCLLLRPERGRVLKGEKPANLAMSAFGVKRTADIGWGAGEVPELLRKP